MARVWSLVLFAYVLTTQNIYAGDADPVVDQDSILHALYDALGYKNASNSLITQTDVERLMRSLKIGNFTDADEHHHHQHLHITHGGSNFSIPCLSSAQLMNIYKIKKSDNMKTLDSQEFAQLQTALVQQQFSGVCEVQEDKLAPAAADFKTYIWAGVSVLVISCLSIVGLLLIPFADSVVYPYLMLFMIALGTGTLVGDAVIHLLPQMFGLHDHSHGDSHEGVHIEPHFNLQCGIFLAMYIFFIIETIGAVLDRRRSSKEERDPLLKMETSGGGGTPPPAHHHHSHHHLHQHHLEKACDHTGAGIHTSALSAYMVMVGDAVHNLADGLAIGAAFAQSPSSGISTSLAVLCHELPHELGDFAILLSAGFSVKRALLLNVVSSIFAFIGLFVAIPLAVDENIRRWIFALTIGMFIFIGLVEMMPILKEIQVPRVLVGAACTHSGMLCGFGIMVVIALFEDQIRL